MVFFIETSWSKSFSNGIVHNRVGVNCTSTSISRNTIRSNTNFLPEQPNLEGQWQIATSEKSYPSMNQNVREGMFMFFDKKPSKRLNFAIWKLVSTLPIQILLKPWSLSFRKDKIKAKTVSKLICLEERKKLRCKLEMKDLVLRSLVRTWAQFR